VVCFVCLDVDAMTIPISLGYLIPPTTSLSGGAANTLHLLRTDVISVPQDSLLIVSVLGRFSSAYPDWCYVQVDVDFGECLFLSFFFVFFCGFWNFRVFVTLRIFFLV
jgi:hypothetical protein